jgi:energy-coupling factor transport system ATP-binding protein
LISVEKVNFHYPGSPKTLHDISLKVNDGEFVAIMGENGAGKTTLVKLFNGLLKPDTGSVLIDNVNIRDRSVAELSRQVGLIFQNPDHQLFAETVGEELRFSLKNFGFKDSVIDNRVTSILTALDIEKYANSSPFMLSGGERKRVALASILVWDPKHVVMDEPTIGQDYLQKDRLRNFIIQLISQKKTVIVVTHDIEFVAECNPRVVLMSKGKIIADGPAQSILTDQRLVEEASLVIPQMTQLMRSVDQLNGPDDIIDVYAARKFITQTLKTRAARQPE